MKKNKFVFVAIIFLAILLVQPQNFQAIVSIFTQNDLKSQLNITGSPGEKNSDISSTYHSKNSELKSQIYDGKNQVIEVHSKAQFMSEELNLEKAPGKNFPVLICSIV